MDITYYPIDIQRCRIVIRSVYDETTTVILRRHDIVHHIVSGAKEWKVLKMKDSNETLTTANTNDTFSGIAIDLILKRLPLFYYVNILLPTALLSLLLPVQFLLPLDCGERVSMGMAMLVVWSVFQFHVAQNVPRFSTDIPILSKFLYVFISNV